MVLIENFLMYAQDLYIWPNFGNLLILLIKMAQIMEIH